MSSIQGIPAFQQKSLHHLTISKLTIPEVIDRAEAEKAAGGLEAIFLQMLIKDMRKNASAMGGDGFFGKGVGSGSQEDLFDSMLAQRISETGHLGLADSVLKNWEESGKIPPEAKENQPESGASR